MTSTLLGSERSLRSLSPPSVGWCLAAPTPTGAHGGSNP